MKSVVGCCLTVAGLALSGCASTASPPPDPPLSIDHGLGSQHGNYVARAAGESRGAAGQRCVTFEWDRPVSGNFAVRYTSMSCEAGAGSGRMVAQQVSRRLIPLSESHLVW